MDGRWWKQQHCNIKHVCQDGFIEGEGVVKSRLESSSAYNFASYHDPTIGSYLLFRNIFPHQHPDRPGCTSDKPPVPADSHDPGAFVDPPRCSGTSLKGFEVGRFRSWSRRPRPLLQKGFNRWQGCNPPVDWLTLSWLCKLGSCWLSAFQFYSSERHPSIWDYQFVWRQKIRCRKFDFVFTWLKPWSGWCKQNQET